MAYENEKVQKIEADTLEGCKTQLCNMYGRDWTYVGHKSKPVKYGLFNLGRKYVVELSYTVGHKNAYEEEKVMEDILSLDILDMEIGDEEITIYTEPEKFLTVKDELDKLGYDKYLASEVTFIPDNYIALDDDGVEKVMALIDALEDLDDVQNVYHNLDI